MDNDLKKVSNDPSNQKQQQLEKTRSNISNTTIRINDNINNNKYKETNNEIIKKSIDTANKYQQEFNKINQNVTDNTIDVTRRLNDFALIYIETFNKSIEIAQKYYNESIQNYLNFVNKIGRSYTNQ